MRTLLIPMFAAAMAVMAVALPGCKDDKAAGPAKVKAPAAYP